MKRVGLLASSLLATAAMACGATGDGTTAGAANITASSGSGIPLFAETSVLHARLEAPLQDLFDRMPKPVPNEYAPGGFDPPDVSKLSVAGKVVYEDPRAGHKEIPVTIKLRGNTSLVELAFPKLTLKLDEAAAKGTLFEHAHKIKLGTHGGEGAGLTGLGRRANQTAPHREAFLYSMLDTLGVTTFKARPAVITYKDTGTRHVAASSPDGTLVRNAFFLEDTDDLAARLGGQDLGDEPSLEELDGKYTNADIARVGLAESLVGNADWEIFRNIWNVKAIATDGGKKTVFVPYDFDLAGTVTGNDANDYPARFFPGKGAAFHDVASLLNKLRSQGYRKAEIDSAVAGFAKKKDALRTLIAGSALPGADKARMQAYVDGFFEATTPASFYLPHTTGPSQIYADPARTKPILPEGVTDEFDALYNCGSPLEILERSPDGKALHVAFVYEDFHGVKDGWIDTESVVGGDGKVPAEVPHCFIPGQD